MAFSVTFADATFTEANFAGNAYADESTGLPGALGKMVLHVGAAFRSPVVATLAVGTGSKSGTTYRNLPIYLGQPGRLVSRANGANFMRGSVTTYQPSNGVLTVTVTSTGGSGTLSDFDWVPEAPGNLSLSGLATVTTMAGTDKLAGIASGTDSTITLDNLSAVLAPLFAADVLTVGGVTMGATGPLPIQRNDAGGSSVLNVVDLIRNATTTFAAGIGTGMRWLTTTSTANNEVGTMLESVATDVTAGSEDFDFVVRTMAAGAVAAERLRVRSDGRATVGAHPVSALDVATLAYAEGMTGSRNRILNGDMRIDQRFAGAATTPVGPTYIVDRWGYFPTQASKMTLQQITSTLAGFRRSLRATTAAAFTPAATDQFVLYHPIEGYNVQDFLFGTASAQPIGLSFRAKASVTGTYCVGLRNESANRSYVSTFALTAGVDTAVALVIPGDTSGTWTVTEAAGITVLFDLGAGANFQTTAGAWQAGNFYRVSGAASLVTSAGATLEISGVQLERLASANAALITPFEHRNVGSELAACQRYYEAGNLGNAFSPGNGTGTNLHVGFMAGKRIVPTMTHSMSASGGYTVSCQNADVWGFNAAIVSGFSGTVVGLTGAWYANAEL